MSSSFVVMSAVNIQEEDMRNITGSQSILQECPGRKGKLYDLFPSYKLLEDVFKVYQEEFSADWVDCICQHTIYE